MTGKYVSETHNDDNFIEGFTRYTNGEILLKTNSWDEFFATAAQYERENFKQETFRELQLFWLTIHVETAFIHFLNLVEKGGYFKKSDFERYLIEKLKNGSGKGSKTSCSTEEAKAILTKESGGSSWVTAHVLCYTTGLTFGGLVKILRDYTTDFPQRNKIFIKIESFVRARNDFIHNLLSTRISSESLIEYALKEGREILLILELLEKIDEEEGEIRLN